MNPGARRAARARFVPALCAALLSAVPAAADTLELEGPLRQGAVVRGKAEPGARLALDGRPVRISPEGRFVLGFGREAAGSALLEVKLPGGGRIERTVDVAPGNFVVQRIDGLPPQTVNPDPETLEKIRREIETVRQARLSESKQKHAFEAFRWPVEGIVTGSWGNQRVLNGEPRAPHWGTDIAAPTGTPVLAPAGGIVRLAATGYVLSGGTVVLDHGYGLSTSYAHLDTLAVAPGQRVAQGEQIGTVGATGRVTGPHLHWSAEWNDVRCDPATLVPPMPVR